MRAKFVDHCRLYGESNIGSAGIHFNDPARTVHSVSVYPNHKRKPEDQYICPEVNTEEDQMGIYQCALCISRPEYMNDNIILTDQEIDDLMIGLNEPGKWKEIIDWLNSEGHSSSEWMNDGDDQWIDVPYYPIPDYTVLKRGL